MGIEAVSFSPYVCPVGGWGVGGSEHKDGAMNLKVGGGGHYIEQRLAKH